MVSAGMDLTALLRSDGCVVMCTRNVRLNVESHTPKLLQARTWIVLFFCEVMAVYCLADPILWDSSTFHRWTMACATPRFLQAVVIQCCSGAMGVLLLAGTMMRDNATFHRWTKGCATPRLLQVKCTLCFSAAMAMLLLAEAMLMENARFRNCTKGCLTPRLLQAVVTQYSSGAMGVLWLAVATVRDNATFHRWTKGCATPRFLQARVIQCSSGAMDVQLLVETIQMDNAMFQLWNLGFATLPILCHFVVETLLCNSILFVKMMQSRWHAPVWPATKSYVWVLVDLIRPGRLIGFWHANWKLLSRVFVWSYLMDSCWLPFARRIRKPQLEIWVKLASVAVLHNFWMDLVRVFFNVTLKKMGWWPQLTSRALLNHQMLRSHFWRSSNWPILQRRGNGVLMAEMGMGQNNSTPTCYCRIKGITIH